MSLLFFNLFESLRDQKNCVVTVELKNGLQMAGTIEAVDQYLNLKLSNVQVTPGIPMSSCFIRGSVIRYINLSQAQLDLAQLQSACRKMELTG